MNYHRSMKYKAFYVLHEKACEDLICSATGTHFGMADWKLHNKTANATIDARIESMLVNPIRVYYVTQYSAEPPY